MRAPPPEDRAPASSAAPVAALIFATLLWGCGFAWAKAAGERVNELSGAGQRALLGPIWVLAIRFLIAGVLWMIVFPSARREWNRTTVLGSLILGGTCALGMIVQHLGLDRTSEAVCAFLTCLTILFVPIIMTFVLRRPPSRIVWVGIAVAGVGVWIMTGATAGGFGAGELLSIACALCYSLNIIALNFWVTPRNAFAITAGQFFITAIVSAIVCLFLPNGATSLAPGAIINLMKDRPIGLNVALLGTLVSMGAFGLQFIFQPRIDPTRATLLYLFEPIFAAIFAWIAFSRGMSAMEILGAGLILLANVVVELLQSRRSSQAKRIID